MTSTLLFTAMRKPWTPASCYLKVRQSQISTCALWVGGNKEETFYTRGPWMASLFAAMGGGVLINTRCEGAFEEHEESHSLGLRDPMTSYAKYAMLKEMLQVPEKRILASNGTSDGLRDPMTSYAKYAMLQEMRNGQHLGEWRSLDAVSVVATTSVQGNNHNDPLPLNPADALNDPIIMSEAEARIEEATRKAKQHSGGLKIFSGNGNMSLALDISRHLGVNLGKATVGRFADGEVNVVIHENVRGKDVYIVQPTCPPVNDNIMELLLMVSTLRRSSARRITVVIPYYGYARQDRKMQVGENTVYSD